MSRCMKVLDGAIRCRRQAAYDNAYCSEHWAMDRLDKEYPGYGLSGNVHRRHRRRKWRQLQLSQNRKSGEKSDTAVALVSLALVSLGMIFFAFVLGFWTHGWLLPWLRGEV